MSGDRIDITVETVRALVAAQFPQWADLPIERVALNGWDNSTFHLGARMKVRLPTAARYALAVEKENTWLPRLAPQLPLPIPVPVAIGVPGQGYAWPWAVYDWLDGETVSAERVRDPEQFAEALAGFLRALWNTDTSGGPMAGEQNFHRGGSLRVYDAEARASMAALAAHIDGPGALAVWEAAVAASWSGPPVWVHGDIAVGNLLVRDGALSAVIDFGGLGVGDPACDLVIAWVFMDEAARGVCREKLGLDAATWARARGWALWKAMLVMERGIVLNSAEKPAAEAIRAVIAEHKRASL